MPYPRTEEEQRRAIAKHIISGPAYPAEQGGHTGLDQDKVTARPINPGPPQTIVRESAPIETGHPDFDRIVSDAIAWYSKAQKAPAPQPEPEVSPEKLALREALARYFGYEGEAQ